MRQKGCRTCVSGRTGLPGWESIPGLLKRFTNTGSGKAVHFHFMGGGGGGIFRALR